MNNALLILSSPRGLESHSRRIATRIVDDIKARYPDLKVAVRDVAREPLPHIGAAFVGGQLRPAEQRSVEERHALAVSDQLVDELLDADVLVLAVPMYNFSLPSSLKAWIDHVVRADRTFSYSEGGVKGLLNSKKAIVVLSRGGVYSDSSMKQFDFQETYLRSILAFIGITDLQIVRVEGVALGADAEKNAVASAYERADEVVREFA